jgi:flagellar motor switch protein FliN/FliY
VTATGQRLLPHLESCVLDVVIALTDTAADQACASAASDDDFVSALSPVMQSVLGGLSALTGSRLGLADLYEMGVGEPLGAPGTEAFTAGLFVGEEQVGNVMFFVVPGAFAAPPAIAAATFPDADADLDDARPNSLSLLRGVEMRVTAELGRTRLPVAHVLELGPGSVVELDRVAGTPVDVLVNGTVIAYGEVVVVDEEYGVRITEIAGTEDTG